MQAMNNVETTSRGPNGNFPVGLHTGQQSLILAELITARNKLEEENRLLRDKLQDAEMLVKLLRHKLRGGKQERKKGTKSSKRIALKARVEHALQWQPPSHRQSQNKDAFLNNAAPGKRLFQTSKNSSFEAVSTRSQNRDNLATTADRTGEEKKEDDCIARKQGATELTNTPIKDARMDSVLGKLAQVVINEYATGDEELHIFK